MDHSAWLLDQAAAPGVQRSPFGAPMWEDNEYMSPGDGVVAGPAYFVAQDGLVPATHWHLRGAEVNGLTLYFTSRNSFVGNGPFVALPPDEVVSKMPAVSARGALRVEVFGGFGGEPHVAVALRELTHFTTHLVGRNVRWAFTIPAYMASSFGVEIVATSARRRSAAWRRSADGLDVVRFDPGKH